MVSVAIPILPCRDLDETLAFYGGLGFTLDFEQLEPAVYAIVSFGEAELHFYGDADFDPRQTTTGAYLRVESADAIHRTWSQLGLPAAGVPSLAGIADRDWGMREFALVDPNGNLLRVGHRID